MHKEIILTNAVYQKLVDYSQSQAPNEAIAIIGCGLSSSSNHCRLLGKCLFLPAPEDYAEQTPFSVRETKKWFHRIADFCAKHSMHMILLHTHPFTTTTVNESPIDRQSASEICAEMIDACPGMAMCTMVMNLAGTHLEAHIYNVRKKEREPVDIVSIPQLQHNKMIYPTSSLLRCNNIGSELFWSRTRLVFGDELIQNNANLQVAIVGAGGLGEPIAVMLANLGVGVTLVDMDIFGEHNVNRSWFGNVTDAKMGRAKVDVVQSAVLQTAPYANVIKIRGDIRDVNVQRQITSCHGLVVAVDNVAARFVCNNLAMTHGLFLFDVGTEIDVKDGSVSSVRGQVMKLIPGTNLCHQCARFFNPADARQGLLNEQDYEIERARGYVRGMDVTAPSVIAVNTVLAGTCVWELMRYLSGVSDVHHPDIVTIDLLRGITQGHDYERNSDDQRTWCPTCSAGGYLFEGDRAPFLHRYQDDCESQLAHITPRGIHARTYSPQHTTGKA